MSYRIKGMNKIVFNIYIFILKMIIFIFSNATMFSKRYNINMQYVYLEMLIKKLIADILNATLTF